MQTFTVLALIMVILTTSSALLAQTEEQYYTELAKITELKESEYVNLGDSLVAHVEVALPSYCFRLDRIASEVKGNLIKVSVIIRAPLEQACPERERRSEYDIFVPGLAEGAYTLHFEDKGGSFVEKAIRVIRSPDLSSLMINKYIGTHKESYRFYPDGVAYYIEEDKPIAFQKVNDLDAFKNLLKALNNKNYFNLLDEDIPIKPEEGQYLTIFEVIFRSDLPELGEKTFKYSFHQKKSAKYVKKIHPILEKVLNSTR